jgi:hypothetical protein
MPLTQLHQVFCGEVIQEMWGRLQVFEDTKGQSKAFAQKVHLIGSPGLRLQDDNNGQAIIIRSPDIAFRHDDAHWPGVIIEVSYPQKRKDLPRLADDYILRTDGNVRVVIGLDIDYETKKGSISMWRPDFVKNKQGQLDLVATQTLYNKVNKSLLENYTITNKD